MQRVSRYIILAVVVLVAGVAVVIKEVQIHADAQVPKQTMTAIVGKVTRGDSAYSNVADMIVSVGTDGVHVNSDGDFVLGTTQQGKLPVTFEQDGKLFVPIDPADATLTITPDGTMPTIVKRYQVKPAGAN